MQLIVAVVQDRDADQVTSTLISKGFRITRIGTTGGLLQQGNTTLLIGVEDAAVKTVLRELQQAARRREMVMAVSAGGSDQAYALNAHTSVEVGGATVFVLNVEHFEQL